MDAQPYGIQWIHHGSGDLKAAQQLIISQRMPEPVHGMLSTEAGHIQNNPQDYLVHDVPTEEDLDQIAAENLIFMAQDGQMVAEIINATTDPSGTVVVAASDGTAIDCLLGASRATTVCADGMEQQGIDSNAGPLVEFNEEYAETQMVTEEVITDDWVQRQGEERVEIPADQIICSSSLATLENEVPLPTVQDEYTALRPYPCDFCSRRFRKKTTLMNHMVAHQNDRPHLCKLCGSRFFRRSDLINHLKAHAETPEPEFEDVDFMKFVDQPTIHYQQQQEQQQQEQQQQHQQQQQQQQQERLQQHHHHHQQLQQESYSEEQYYDASWTVQTNRGTRTQNNSVSSNPRRGRTSRLKPRMENNYTIDETLRQSQESSDAAPTTQSEYGESQEVEATPAHELIDDAPKQFPVIDDSKPFVCQECGLAFAREKALLAHIKQSHRNDAPYECSQCNEMFWDSMSLQEHLKTHQFEDSNSEYEPAEAEETQTDSESEYLYGEFYCAECGMSFHRQDLLVRHAKVHQKNVSGDTKDQHCCNTCGESFAEALDLLAHAEIHARYPPFKCVHCGESFFEEATIKRHLNTVHAKEITANSCILCGKVCRDRKALMKHAWDHSREKSHSCSKCGKNFNNKARLKRHMVSHRDKSVMCEVCHEEFPDGRTLSNHRHSHSTNGSGKLFACNECGKTFGSRSSQQIHVRIHTGERPYGCRYCWKAFADGGTLRKHERIHTGEKPYACAVCPRAFNQRVVLREHIRSHHSSMDARRGTYHCTVCSAELVSSPDLIQHLIQHSDMNTAMQRQPITGPRKYKRRRKLAPHEIAHLRSAHQTNGGAAEGSTDIDISDFDVDNVDNVDDLLAIAEPASGASKRRKRKNTKAAGKTAGDGEGNPSFEQDHPSHQYSDATTLYTKERYNSSGSNSDGKSGSWQTKLMTSNCNDENYKSLFTNLETTLQTIDTLVVGNKSSNNGGHIDVEARQGTDDLNLIKSEPPTMRAQHSASTAARVRSNRKVVKNKTAKSAKSSRPRMIHTERKRMSPKADSSTRGRRRPKTLITRSETTRVEVLANRSVDSGHLANHYEMLLPEMQAQSQEVSSNAADGIKQEYSHQTTTSGNNNTQQYRSSDLYDAQLLLEAASLRKDIYEKYNPSIVNDLEQILRSPDKSSDKSRHRFTSESSTGIYMMEPAEEEQHLIKIEPTSPDIHDIVVGSSSGSLQTQQQQHQQQRTPQRSTRRRPVSNRRYLEFETDLTNLPSNHTSPLPVKANRHQNAAKSRPTVVTYSKSYSPHYAPSDYQSVVATTSSSSASSVATSSFSSISAVVAAAAANDEAQAACTVDRKPQRYYECEMCSAVFPDRAQLLDHVPIHI